MVIHNILSIDAYQLIHTNDSSLIIDVRSDLEHQIIGTPHVYLDRIILLEWMCQNSNSKYEFYHKLLNLICKKYVSSLNTYTFEMDKIKLLHLLFICRSGVRSQNAAVLLRNYGFTNCYNIVDGMEGMKYGKGWIENKLPYFFNINKFI